VLIVARREDDTNWPKKNIVGKQELEIRVGNDHIAFEVLPTPLPHGRFRANVFPARPPKSARWLTSRTARIQKGFVCFTTLSRTSRSVPTGRFYLYDPALTPTAFAVPHLLPHFPALQDQAHLVCWSRSRKEKRYLAVSCDISGMESCGCGCCVDNYWSGDFNAT
jgi:hypothetical protein